MSLLFRHLPTYAIFGANTDVGKTIITTALCRAAAAITSPDSPSEGEKPIKSVHYIKPVSTGPLKEADDLHVRHFAGPNGSRIGTTCLFRYDDPVSPHLAVKRSQKRKTPPTDEKIIQSIRKHLHSVAPPHADLAPGFAFLETAGGVLSPSLTGAPQASSLRPLRLPVLLVGDSKLGGISATISAWESLHLRGWDVSGVLLFQEEYYRNWEYLKDYFGKEARDMGLWTLPPPPARLANHKEDQKALEQYYSSLADTDASPLRPVLHDLRKRHEARLDALEAAGPTAKEVVWWPFTQHEKVRSVMVIDSAEGDMYSVYQSDTPVPLRHPIVAEEFVDTEESDDAEESVAAEEFDDAEESEDAEDAVDAEELVHVEESVATQASITDNDALTAPDSLTAHAPTTTHGPGSLTTSTPTSRASLGDPEIAPSLLETTYDGSASWWTQAWGHGHPSLTLAAAHAAGRYGHVIFPSAVHEPALQLAERLIGPGGPGEGWADRVFWSDDGSTAVEVAIKMATRSVALRRARAGAPRIAASSQEGSPQESSAQGSAPQESAAEQVASPASAAQESTSQDSSSQDSSSQNSTSQDSTSEESTSEESTSEESTSEDSTMSESLSQESSPQQSPAQEAKVGEELGIIGISGSYHGDTIGAMDASEPSVYNAAVPWYKGRGLWLDPPSISIQRGKVVLELPVRRISPDPGMEPPQRYRVRSLRQMYDVEARLNSWVAPRYRDYIERKLLGAIAEGKKFGALLIEPICLGAGGMVFVDPLFQRILIDTVRSFGRAFGTTIPVPVDHVEEEVVPNDPLPEVPPIGYGAAARDAALIIEEEDMAVLPTASDLVDDDDDVETTPFVEKSPYTPLAWKLAVAQQDPSISGEAALSRRSAEAKAREWQGLPVIFDEVFTGFYRLGVSPSKVLGVKPDIATYAKILTGGLVPMSVTLASESIFRTFAGDRTEQALLHGHSYTAHPVGCAVALKSMDLIEEVKSSDGWGTAREEWATAARRTDTGPTSRDEMIGEPAANEVWSLWSLKAVMRISHLRAVKKTMAMGTVLAVTLDLPGEGYAAEGGKKFLEYMQRTWSSDLPAGIHTRSLGKTVYFMSSLNTPSETLRTVETELKRALRGWKYERENWLIRLEFNLPDPTEV